MPRGTRTSLDSTESSHQQLLHTLLNALQELGKDGDNTLVDQARKMVETFLRNLAHAARQLDNPIGILSSSLYLRDRLARILYLFRDNAADLFPTRVQRQPREDVINLTVRKRSKAAARYNADPDMLDGLDAEDLPDQLHGLAREVAALLDCMEESQEYTDEGMKASFATFEGDLVYWASCLQAYEGRFKTPAVQRYLHDLASSMGEYIDNVVSSLQIFVEIGVPSIASHQKHAADNLLTVATFFSAVTATTLQFSYTQTDGPLQNSVNGFWFTSLVFSLAAVVNSLLGVDWKQEMHRGPGHRIPWWVLAWIKKSPLVFLVLSVACFSVGLVVFAFSSGQHLITSTVTTALSACSSFGIAAVACWFASRRTVSIMHASGTWLMDALSRADTSIRRLLGTDLVLSSFRVSVRAAAFWIERICRGAARVIRTVLSTKPQREDRPQRSTSDPESPDTGDSGNKYLKSYSVSHPTSTGALSECISLRSYDLFSGPTVTSTPLSQPIFVTIDGPEDTVVADGESAGTITHSSIIAQTQSALSIADHIKAAPLQFPDSSRSERMTSAMVQRSPTKQRVPLLKQVERCFDLNPHQSLVRDLQFSPDGRYLATSSWDQTSVIFAIDEDMTADEPIVVDRTLKHEAGFVRQIIWSPDGRQVLTRTGREVQIWTEDGACKRKIDRATTLQAIAWLPGGDAFLAAEGAYITKLDLVGKVLGQYYFGPMIIHDMTATTDSRRMMCVGVLTSSSNGLRPKKSRAESQIIVYNFETHEIEDRVPVVHDIRHIRMSRSGDMALISYENRAPPQLWQLEYSDEIARLQLRHTYMPKRPVDFSGPSYFGGKQDELVICTDKAGDVHIWDRESGALLRHVRLHALGGGGLTCITCSPSADPLMFATGTNDGKVHLWTITQKEREVMRRLDDDLSYRAAQTVLIPRSSSPDVFEHDS
ncbi:WD40 repeat domain-containing protein [Phanerochaete sordida]|uniref:WD40 repeat domain-containing protein n=1 Tax=Phanerochaete sordida TaxID=48140 RepID=A0A9P3GIH3_9APHY|nr:WD40 repeat domain-containing protein [Phanerochaete sordida]